MKPRVPSTWYPVSYQYHTNRVAIHQVYLVRGISYQSTIVVAWLLSHHFLSCSIFCLVLEIGSLRVARCERVTYFAIGVKDRSITQAKVILIITLSPPLNGGIFGASESSTSVR